MSNEKSIDTIVVELDHISETYQRYTGFNAKSEAVKSRHQTEKNTITSLTKDKMKACEEKIMTASKVAKPMVDKALLTPIPALPEIPSSENHLKTIMLSSASGLAILLGLALAMISFLPVINTLCSVSLLGGLFVWFLLGGAKAVEGYLKWQKEIIEYNKQLEDWVCEYGKLDLNKSSDKLMADVAIYEKEFLSIVKECDEMFDRLFKEMTREKSELSKKHHTELEQLEKEWIEICSDLKSVTLIHSDLFYIAWRISSALERGRASTLQEAINIAINDERLAREEEARQAEARRQEAILQRQAEDTRRHNEALERAARERAREAARQTQIAQDQAREAARQTQIAQNQAREAEKAARTRCMVCANKDKCYIRNGPAAIGCTSYRPK